MTQTFISFQDFKRRYPIRPNDPDASLGSGSYGRVIKVEDQLETEWVAIKISEFKGNDSKSLKAEVELARRVPRQANIARYDACYRLETDTSISDFAIMKYYQDGNLADLLQREPLTSAQRYDITKGILLGLQHLHRHRIVHRDFKPANILISRDNAGRFIPKIADFGLSKLVSDDELNRSDFDLSDGRGTPSYKAPEQIEGSRVSFNLDLWAFGIILYEILTGEKPFRADLRNASEQSIRREIEKKIVTVTLPDRLNELEEPYQTMIRRCLVRDIHARVRKEEELLDLLDQIPQLMQEAEKWVEQKAFEKAIGLYEQVLSKRENHAEAGEKKAQCKAEIQQQHITHLMGEADRLLAYHQLEEARNKYELVLQLDPTQEAAVRGLAICIENLRPKNIMVEAELTDVYVPESTDLYIPPPVKPKPQQVPVTKKETVPPARVIAAPASQPEMGPIDLVNKSYIRGFPWQIVATVTVVAAGVLWYFTQSGSGEKPITGTENATNEPVKSSPVSTETTNPDNVTPPLEGSNPASFVDAKAALSKRIDVALKKAQRAFENKDYVMVLMLTNSALQLDPTRRDVLSLRNAAQNESLKGEEELENSTPQKPASEDKPTEPSEEQQRLTAQKEHQNRYEQLVEEGTKAMGSNNKTRAITSFTNAQTLAKEHELITAKADAAYADCLRRGQSYFNRDEFEGAKGWYLVAQSLKDTEEVRRKIKQCSN
ncbi:protein kinase [Larkinella insperata]|uniref:Protein kinase n=1 Tax=Larkinella insperata TaxID=332158 RepID=A0ABW3QCN2_9BACT